MAKLCMILTLFATFSLFLLTSTGSGNPATSAPGEAAAKQSGFELPQKTKSTMTASEQRGGNLYAYYCSVCHGKTGEGDGINSFQLSTPPAKHADAALMSTLSDADIQKVIKGGGPALGRSPQMPPWGRVFTERDVTDLVAFIRTLSKK
jgi:mono/diheme cytochrome c family protein